MSNGNLDKTIAGWTRFGVLFGGAPAEHSPDLEQLLLDTARHSPSSPRLFHLVVTWLSQYGSLVARPRLRYLVKTELDPEDQPVLGLLVDLAVKHGGPLGLYRVTDPCTPAQQLRPLFDLYRDHPALTVIAQRQTCSEALRWNLWADDQEPKLDAIRPRQWILDHNSFYHEHYPLPWRNPDCP